MDPKQLWEEFHTISNYCREYTSFKRIDIQRIKTSNEELKHHIWKNGTMKSSRNIAMIDNNLDPLVSGSLKSKFDEGTKISIINITKMASKCSLFNEKSCDGEESLPLTLFTRIGDGNSTGNFAAIFSKLNKKTIDFMEIGEYSFNLLRNFVKNRASDKIKLIVCQISVSLHGPGIFSRKSIHKKFYKIWWQLMQDGRFTPLIATMKKRTVLLLNVEDDYCVQNYIKPFFLNKNIP